MSDLATRDVPLGPCDCPGTPHAEGDVAVLKKPESLRYGDIRRIGAAYQEDVAGMNPLDGGRAMSVFMWRAIISWNKVREDPRGGGLIVLLPVTLATIDDLSSDQAKMLIPILNEFEYIRLIVGDEQARAAVGPVPTPAADAPDASVQAFSGNGVGNGAADTRTGLELAAVTPPNPSSGSSADGSAGSTPSTISSASPAPI